MAEEMDQTWRTLSERILRDIKEWRRVHPKATFREIKQEVHPRMSCLEAQVLQDTVQQSSSREWSGASKQGRPACPACGTPLQARGKQSRRLQGARGQDVQLHRTYGTCPTCGTGLFPAFMKCEGCCREVSPLAARTSGSSGHLGTICPRGPNVGAPARSAGE
jgi:hypothetical protein